jgi:lysophospholipid acyltransferase (LPLAT)-like uncharacterized protein
MDDATNPPLPGVDPESSTRRRNRSRRRRRRRDGTTGKISIRRLRFALLEKVVLPLLIPVLRLWVLSWRKVEPEPELLRRANSRPRLVLLTYHGMLASSLAFAHLPPRYGRRLVVMLSPSLDGRLLAALLSHFGIGHVFATSGSRGVAGSRELARRVAAGDVAVIAVDGPRGPRGVIKPGAARLAEVFDADFLLHVPAAERGFALPSWDGAFVPWPFSRVTLHLRHLRGAAARAEPAAAALHEMSQLPSVRRRT